MGAFFETIKNLKRSAPGPQICPVCGSIKVKQQGSLNGWLLPPVYACADCGYVGGIILELEEANNDSKKM